MSDPRYNYRKDQELPSLGLRWEATDGTARDFSTGWTFTVKLQAEDGTTALTKTTGITGASTFPNVTVAWSVTDWSALTALTAGTPYRVIVYARRTADSVDEVFRSGDEPLLWLYPAAA